MASSPPVPSSVQDQPGTQRGSPQTEIQSLLKAGITLFHDNQDPRALAAFKKAFLLSSRLPEPHVQAKCLFNLGAAYIASGKPKKGLKCTWKARKMGAMEEDGDFSFNIAAAYDNLREYAKAAKFYEKAVCEYETRKTPNVADALVKLAYCLASTGDSASAAESFRLAGWAYQEVQQPEDAAMAMREAANYFLRSPKYHPEDVLQALHACSQLCAGIADLELLGKLHNHLGLHYAELKHFGQAKVHFAKALRLCRGENFAIRKRAVLLQNLGAVHNATEEFQWALKYHREAADAYRALGETASQAQCLYNLANAYSQLGDYHDARLHYQQALKAFGEAGDLYGEAQGCEGLGTVHLCLGDSDQATGYYKQALTLFGKSKEASDIPRERILQKLADAANYGEAAQGRRSPTGRIVDSGAADEAGSLQQRFVCCKRPNQMPPETTCRDLFAAKRRNPEGEQQS
ncbi:tetratricopeptide repeat protein 24-like [Sphaerodactylus townsendi]|uniref:tetratricopeptide repeat protein 24-like n=1 Tax=Sphaerodactylus townsendi TaxID=933632 RepID=UPI002026160B|nr:tetratricopeptide repeat protein 24-like [Sphaerodactylus townsendi]